MRRLLALAVLILGMEPVAGAPALVTGETLPTGQRITPTVAAGASFQPLGVDLPGLPGHEVGQAASLALSPDGRTLLILTSGFNRMFGADGKPIPALSNEYVFVYDVSGSRPIRRQVLTLANAMFGIAWAPAGDGFFVAGGVDDVVVQFRRAGGAFAEARRIALGHKAGLGVRVKPAASAVAVSPDGRRLLVANYENDSVSLIDLARGAVVAEQDLRPGVIDPRVAGTPGGSYPRAVAWTSNAKAWVATQRDREIIALTVSGARVTVGSRLKMRGQPVAMVANASKSRLYAALDNSDGLAVIDTVRDRLVESIPTVAPASILADAGRLGGAGSNALALSRDGGTLLVSNGAQNSVAVVALSPTARGMAAARASDRDDDDAPAAKRSEVVGLIPTGWYPTAVAVRPDGRLFVVNAKSLPGPNPNGCRDTLGTAPEAEAACQDNNQYVWQLQKAGFLVLPRPAPAELGRLTRQVAANNHFPGSRDLAADAKMMAFLRERIRHVIYVVKENRSYDQVLGDLEVGNGDRRLTLLPEPLTPNHHALARQFVTLDAFEDSGESSNTGWNWTTAARANDYAERAAPINYAGRGLSYDHEGDNRNVNMGLATSAERIAANPMTPKDANLLPGTADVAAPDGPGGAIGEGYLWDTALRAGKTVRNYGFYGDLFRYYAPAESGALIPLDREPHKTGRRVFYPSKAALATVTDPYFRGFDMNFPDYWRFKEWEREFDGYVAAGSLPNLSLVRLPHDHFGSFETAIDGVNTVETQMADNDYALGLLIEKVAASRFAADTLIFVIEDDAQDGPDHVSARRSIAFVAGPYVRRGAVVSERYNTVSMVRTMEDILGLAPLGLNDAMARPMSAVFDPEVTTWSYRALVPAILRTTRLPLPADRAADAGAGCATGYRSAAYWTKAMAGQNFNDEDHLDTAAFNRALWHGLDQAGAPQPVKRDGENLRKNRAPGVASCALTRRATKK